MTEEAHVHSGPWIELAVGGHPDREKAELLREDKPCALTTSLAFFLIPRLLMAYLEVDKKNVRS